MPKSDFKFTLSTDQTAEQVFRAITNVRGWWSGYHGELIEGGTANLNDEFTFSAGEGAHYSKQKLIEVIPNKKIVWLITDSELKFVHEKHEWTGTKVIFDIAEKDGKTELTFIHEGLNPDFECYDVCAPTWSQYLQNRLLPLIEAQR